MADNILDSIFVDMCFLCRGYKVGATIVRSVLGIKVQFLANHHESVVVFGEALRLIRQKYTA